MGSRTIETTISSSVSDDMPPYNEIAPYNPSRHQIENLKIIHLKGSSNKKFLLPKPHILDSIGIWYGAFWSEWPENHLNFGLKVCPPVTSRGAAPGPRGVVPWNLEGWCHGTSRGALHRTSRGGAIGP